MKTDKQTRRTSASGLKDFPGCISRCKLQFFIWRHKSTLSFEVLEWSECKTLANDVLTLLSQNFYKWNFLGYFTVSIFKFTIDDVNDSRYCCFTWAYLTWARYICMLYSLLISRRRRHNLSPNHITVMTWLKLFFIADPVESTAIHSRWTYAVRHVWNFLLFYKYNNFNLFIFF